MKTDQVVRWAVRVLWVALPFTVGGVLGDALAAASRPVQVVATAGLWLAWAVGLVATAVALPLSLTALRVLGPAVVAAALAAALGGHGSALAVGWAAVTAAWVFAPPLGAICVNGPAYPNERRFLLRLPAALLFGPLALAWAVTVVGISAGPLLLAARQWILGGLLTVLGLPAAALLLKGLHNLSRRWAVFVPAGLVLHDPLTLVDPVLVRRPSITRMGLAAANTPALDLSQRAPGLAVEIDSREDIDLALVRPGKRLGETVKATRVLLTPTRPGAVLAEAKRRRFPVG